MKRAIRIGGLACLSLLLSAAVTRAAVLFEDDFTYSNGNLISVGSAKWKQLTTPSDLIVDNGAVLLRSDKSQDVKSTVFPTVTPASVDLYAAFDLTPVTTPKSNGNYFLAFNEAEIGGVASYVARLHLKPSPTTAGKVVLGLSTIGVATPAYATQEFTLGQTISVILGYRPEGPGGIRQARLWVNAASESESILSVVNPDNDIADRLALRQPTNTTDSYGSLRIDNLKVTNAFTDLIPVHAPEPGTLLGGLAAAFVLLNRRRGAAR